MRGRSVEHEANVVFGLLSAWAVIPNDLNQPTEHGLADSGTSVGQHLLHISSKDRSAAAPSRYERALFDRVGGS